MIKAFGKLIRPVVLYTGSATIIMFAADRFGVAPVVAGLIVGAAVGVVDLCVSWIVGDKSWTFYPFRK
ncbi:MULTISPECIES: hypothetical protein [unclassified Haematobacter]|uniref:hypothetical protein n=1 Tax=unclassified Haematobacter TaxID=2640585 RepID=UPI0025C596C3|nr:MULTISPECIES: hypothetical protein [unclassified Haematobacter]